MMDDLSELEGLPILICDMCEEESCSGSYYWKDKDFRLCFVCIHSLYMREFGYISVENEESKPTKKAVIPSALRWEVWERDDFRCRYCGERKRLTIDHVIPESQNGSQDLSNLVTACKSCNSRKGARSPEQSGMNLR